MGAVVSSLGAVAASGLINLVVVGLLGWRAAAAIEVCESSLEDERPGGGVWRRIRCELPADSGRGASRAKDSPARCGKGSSVEAAAAGGREHRLSSAPRGGGTAASRSVRLSLALGKQSQGGASCRLSSTSGNSGGGGGGERSVATTATVAAASPPVALASTNHRRRRNGRGSVGDADDADGDCDNDDDDSVERSNDAFRHGALAPAGASPCAAQLHRAVRSKAIDNACAQPSSGHSDQRKSRGELALAAGEKCAHSASSPAAFCVVVGNCASTDDSAAARSAAHSSPCRFYYCSSSLGTNAGDDRSSAPPPPQQPRMLSIAPTAAATKSAADTRMTNNNSNNISSINNNNNNNHDDHNSSKIHLQTNINKNNKHSTGNQKHVSDLAMEPIGGYGRQRSILIKSRQTQFAQTKSAASSLDSGHSGGGSGGSSRGSHSDLSTASSTILNTAINNNNNNNVEEDQDDNQQYSKSNSTSSNMLHPTVTALLQSTANLTLTKHSVAYDQSPNLVVDVDTPPPSPLKRSKKMQAPYAGDQLSLKHQRNHHYQQQQQHYQLHQEQTAPLDATPVNPRQQHALQPQSQSQQSLTQDATYLTPVPDRKHLTELLATAKCGPLQGESRPPPRPWLSPAQQLQLLSKGRLKQLLQAGRIDRRQYEQVVEVKPSRRQTKSKWHLDTLRPAQTYFDTACSGLSSDEFTVLSYNVLSDRMVNPKQFPSSPDLALNWLYRSELILRQLLDHDADIVALQELEMEQFESFFRPKLDELGQYTGLFESKSRARTMDSQMRKRVDGCAIFYKRNKFKLVGKHLLEFNQIAMANSRGSEAMLNRVMTKDNIGLVAVLELIGESSIDSSASDSSSTTQRHRFHDDPDNDYDGGDETLLEYFPELRTRSGSSRTTSTSMSSESISSASRTTASKRLIVCNTHIHWDPNYCDVKLIQTIMLMNELRHIAHHYRSDAAAATTTAATPARSGDDSAAASERLDEPKQLLQQASSADDDIDDDLKGEPLVPLVLLGDFNSIQKSGVVQFLLNGAIDSSHKDFKDFKYTPCTNSLTPLDWRHRGARHQQRRPLGPHLSHPLVSRRASDQPPQALADGQSPVAARYLEESTTPTSSLVSLARRQSSPVTGSSDNSSTGSPSPCSPLCTVAPPDTNNAADGKQDHLMQDNLISYEHPFKLASAYEKGVMPFTNYCTHFKATIDYIFYDNNQLQLMASLGPLDKDWLKRSKLNGFPQMDFPSDHLPLMARFRLSNPEAEDYDDDHSSLTNLSSVETRSMSALAPTAPNCHNSADRHHQQPVAPMRTIDSTLAKSNPDLMPAINQQRNQRKQLLFVNQNLRRKFQQQQQPVTAATVAASGLPRASRGSGEQTPPTAWYRLRREPQPTATTKPRQEARPELTINSNNIQHQGNSNHYHCYLPSQHLKLHLQRQQRQQQQVPQLQHHTKQMQFIKERAESYNNNNHSSSVKVKININNHDNHDDGKNQDGAKSQPAATSRRAAKQLRRQQLQRKLKQMRPEKGWPEEPFLVKLKEDWS